MFCERSSFQKYSRRLSQGQSKRKTYFTSDRNKNIYTQEKTPSQQKSLDDKKMVKDWSFKDVKQREFAPQFFKQYNIKKPTFSVKNKKEEQLIETLDQIKVLCPGVFDTQKNKKSSNRIFKPNQIKNNRFNSNIFQNSFQSNFAKQLSSQSQNFRFQKQSNLIGESYIRKSTSIMMIRKLKKKRQESISQQQSKEGFKNKKSIPIHHSQYYFCQNERRKTEGCSIDEENKKKLLMMADFVKIGQTFSQDNNLDEEMLEKVSMIQVLHGKHIEKRNLQLSLQRKYSPKKSIKSNKRKIKGSLFNSKIQQNDFGPWKRAASNDFDQFI